MPGANSFFQKDPRIPDHSTFVVFTAPCVFPLRNLHLNLICNWETTEAGTLPSGLGLQAPPLPNGRQMGCAITAPSPGVLRCHCLQSDFFRPALCLHIDLDGTAFLFCFKVRKHNGYCTDLDQTAFKPQSVTSQSRVRSKMRRDCSVPQFPHCHKWQS